MGYSAMGCPFFDLLSMSFGMVCMFGGGFRIGTSFREEADDPCEYVGYKEIELVNSTGS